MRESPFLRQGPAPELRKSSKRKKGGVRARASEQASEEVQVFYSMALAACPQRIPLRGYWYGSQLNHQELDRRQCMFPFGPAISGTTF